MAAQQQLLAAIDGELDAADESIVDAVLAQIVRHCI